MSEQTKKKGKSKVRPSGIEGRGEIWHLPFRPHTDRIKLDGRSPFPLHRKSGKGLG
jgi:hypothetical protein